MSNLLKDVSGGEWYQGALTEQTWETPACHVALIENDGVAFAEVQGGTHEQALANAKLMAAAKDMAEALIEARAALNTHLSSDLRDQLDEIIDAALKKAGIE